MFRLALCLALLMPAGRVEEHRITSRVLGEERRFWVYTPPGYSKETAGGYALLVAFDGREYLEDIPLPPMLERLVSESKAPPFVAVLIDNKTGAARLSDLGNRAKFADFVSDELLDFVRERWNVTRDPRRTIVEGSSAGGLAAAFLAFRRPDVFGNVLSQSGAFWRGAEASNEPPYEWLTGRYEASPRKNIRFYLDVGELENRGALGGAAPSILEANRRLRDTLRRKGYEVEYHEVPGGTHSQESWKLRLPGAIAGLARPSGR